MNHISQYDEIITKEKEKYKRIDKGNKWKVNALVPLLNLLEANHRFPLFHQSRKTIKHVETENKIPQFYVKYMSMSFFFLLSEKN